MENKEIIDTETIAPVLKNIVYPVSEDTLNALVLKYANIPDIDLNASDEIVAEQFKFVRDGQILFSKERNKIEKTRKAIKDPAYTFGKNVDAYAKKLQSIIKDTEDKLKLQRDRVEQNEARKQREAEEAEEQRISNIQALINRYKNMPMECIGKSSIVIQKAIDLVEMPKEDTLQEFYDEALVIHSASIAQMQQMLNNQITVENAEKIAQEAQEKADEEERERQSKRDAEQKKLDDERAEFEKQKRDFEYQQKAIQEEKDREQAEREADELMKKQESERQQREEQNALNRENSISDTLESMNKYTDNQLLLNEIIAGVIPNIKWVQDGN